MTPADSIIKSEIYILKFKEIGTHAGTVSGEQLKEYQVEKKSTKRSTFVPDDRSGADGMPQSDGNSSLSFGQEADDSKSIKDPRAMIAEKKTPKDIVSLKRKIVIMTIVLLSLQSVDWWIKQGLIDENSDNYGYVRQLYYRKVLVSDLQFYTRKLELVASGI